MLPVPPRDGHGIIRQRLSPALQTGPCGIFETGRSSRSTLGL